MHVNGDAFRAMVKATVGAGEGGYRDGMTVDEADARAVLGICALVAGADDKADPEEDSVLGEIAGHLGPTVPDVRANDDLERLEKIREIGGELSTQGVRDLAYALAYVVAVADLELAPAESEFLADLAVALGVSDERAGELAQRVAEAVTPGV
jgi:tellurite resistance protein